VPLAWLYDGCFVRSSLCVWGVAEECGLDVSMGHGGGQFSLSAKTFLQGSLLADDIATKLNHPELSTWIFGFPESDARAFRATAPRFRAFEHILEQYWQGAFHPRALGGLTAANALLDRGFGPALQAAGPRRCAARPVRRRARGVPDQLRLRAQGALERAGHRHGYWQSAHPDEDGYRPDQIMRYGEGNLNRLQIAGEWHVKSGKVLDDGRTCPSSTRRSSWTCSTARRAGSSGRTWPTRARRTWSRPCCSTRTTRATCSSIRT
jgi:hypothetical protein